MLISPWKTFLLSLSGVFYQWVYVKGFLTDFFSLNDHLQSSKTSIKGISQFQDLFETLKQLILVNGDTTSPTRNNLISQRA